MNHRLINAVSTPKVHKNWVYVENPVEKSIEIQLNCAPGRLPPGRPPPDAAAGLLRQDGGGGSGGAGAPSLGVGLGEVRLADGHPLGRS